MKVKTSELQGAALDWAVAKCENVENQGEGFIWFDQFDRQVSYSPSTDWAQGGPIIDRQDIQWCRLNGQIEAWSGFDYIKWRMDWDSDERMPNGAGFGTGANPLIATMRCYVSSKLGEEVEVPDELLTP